jgi:hypothetical protein
MNFSSLTRAAIVVVALSCVLVVGGCGHSNSGAGEGSSKCVDSNAPDMTVEEMTAGIQKAYEPIDKAVTGFSAQLSSMVTSLQGDPAFADLIRQAPKGGQGRYTAAVCDLADYDDHTYDDGTVTTSRGIHGYIPATGFSTCSIVRAGVNNGSSIQDMMNQLKADTTRQQGSDPDSVKQRREAESQYGLTKAAIESLCPQYKP